MEQLLQVRVIVQTIDTERVITALSSLVSFLYPQDIPKNGLTIDELLDTIVIYHKITTFPKNIEPYVQSVIQQYTLLQNAVAQWQAGKASTQAVLLEEALYALNSAIDGENYAQ